MIVDDEVAIRDMVRMALELDGFSVSDASSAHHAERLMNDRAPDLMLLDWMMPGVSGIDFATKLRKSDDFSSVGIIMLTAKDEESDKIRGLDVGADDYICKPFSTRELISRIHAVLRRTKGGDQTVSMITSGKITVDNNMHQVFIDDQKVDLSPTEYRLLLFLMSHPDRVFSRTHLLDQVWGENIYVEERTVDVHIRRLRKVLENFDCSSYIKTIRSVGYRFSMPD